jgi:hypothetical protein
MKKLILRLLIALVVLVILAVAGVAFFLDSAIKKGVETVGPQIAKVDIRLDGVSLSLLSGSGKIKGLVVSNPEGYKTPHAISVGSASLAVSPGSVFSDKVVIKSIRVESPEIYYEGGLGGDNLRKILDNVTASTASATTEPAAKSDQPAKKLQVDDFVITGAKLKISIKGTDGFAAPIPLPDIHFTNLGQGPEGITAGELTKKVFTELTASVAKNAAGAIADLGKGAVDSATKTATESVNKATKGITDLFKKKKE